MQLKRHIFALISAQFISQAAVAQDAIECTAISDSMNRLQCYDQIFLAPDSANQATEEMPATDLSVLQEITYFYKETNKADPNYGRSEEHGSVIDGCNLYFFKAIYTANKKYPNDINYYVDIVPLNNVQKFSIKGVDAYFNIDRGANAYTVNFSSDEIMSAMTLGKEFVELSAQTGVKPSEIRSTALYEFIKTSADKEEATQILDRLIKLCAVK